jgi:hypothetical protein
VTGPQGDWRPPAGTGQQPAPMNAPPAQPLSIGVQPGTPNIIRAFIVIISGGAGSGLFVYSPRVGAGNLILSVAGQAGTDPYGNAYLGNGLAVYGSGFTEFLGLIGGVPELQFRTGLANESTPANLAGGVVGAGVAETMQLLMSGPKGAAVGGRDWAQVYLISNNSGVTAPAQGQLRFISDTAVVTNPLIWDINGVNLPNRTDPPANLTGSQIYGASGLSSHLKYVAADANPYATGRQTLLVTTTPTINSATFATITTPASTNLGVGTYLIRGQIYYTPNQAAGAGLLKFVSTATFSAIRVAFVEYAGIPAINTSGAWVVGNIAQINMTGPFQSATFGATDRLVTFDGWCTTTVGGTISLEAACTVAADTWTIKPASYMDLCPVP